jgi:hypothetical protein
MVCDETVLNKTKVLLEVWRENGTKYLIKQEKSKSYFGANLMKLLG